MSRMLRILLVEDETFIAMTLRLQLNRAGYTVETIASSGEDAVTLAAELSPDVVLMDVGLPGDIDGIEAAQYIRAVAKIPIIFMTGYQHAEMLERIKALHPVACLDKPVNLHMLKAALESISCE